MKENKENFFKKLWNKYLQRLEEEQKKGKACLK
ncbi:hypothetical protein MHK_004509 [Candidatus Magnetomorum sp. HK-1]|nr:hypothetical protein MHK_004509 [Candidatus Magnetomorum sp. HK-1]